MKIDRATAEAVRAVALNMRPRDFDEFSAVAPAETRAELASLLARSYGGREDVLCGWDGDRPVAIGGTLELRPNVITLLFFATPAFATIALPATRFIRKQLFPRYFAAGVHRIEAVSLANNDEAHGWLRTLGLTQETGPMPGYGKRGEAFVQFALVQHDVRSTGDR